MRFLFFLIPSHGEIAIKIHLFRKCTLRVLHLLQNQTMYFETKIAIIILGSSTPVSTPFATFRSRFDLSGESSCVSRSQTLQLVEREDETRKRERMRLTDGRTRREAEGREEEKEERRKKKRKKKRNQREEISRSKLFASKKLGMTVWRGEFVAR